MLPFAGAELAALGIAFVLNGRHAADYERLDLDVGRLLVEVCEAESIHRNEFNPACASVQVADEGRSVRLLLETPGRRLEIGRHLHEQARRDLADELNRRLRN